ncbi:beta-N-acetylhexosaminidase [Chryseosolibacter indicus]|uniref:beta-N-acetylhexosaminidase n=1 Tax=Chryseosolibacter indicus TaxID=2782351 RepID=A0ABS5VJT2_9BACT|nr:beta-N-acetylhexosaminidase [Chryseosolibacter indicus]MBT1701695.1 family 20 glycosylhydrolase [Chryseosolibacter indicus]
MLRFTRSFKTLILAIGFFCFVSCSNTSTVSENAKVAFESVIPKPVSSSITNKAFTFSKETSIVVSDNAETLAIANEFAQFIKRASGLEVPVTTTKGEEATSHAIYLTVGGDDQQLGNEGYEVTITEERIHAKANSPAGIFYAVQTLRQMLPPAVEGKTQRNTKLEIVTGVVKDYPLYGWRGSMLDVARHFFSVEDVKRYIDLISYYKMNVLHLHLSDDQGWRIEIKSWPKLTEVGGSTQVGGGKGGFYTQDQYKDIVAYAKSRFVTIVPEIDMPGHINAALASYAELNAGPPIKREAGANESPVQASQEVKPKPVAGQLYTGIEVGFSTLHLKKDATFKFVNDVIRELAEITPGQYLHIGGDEAAVTKKEDYIQFINRFKEIVSANGKKMIGWEEVAQGEIDSTTIVQYWHSEKYAKQAVDKGAKIIFSPSTKTYLDMQYDSTSRIGLHWAAYIEADSAYIWDPARLVEGISKDQILGVEAPLWTETVVTMDDIEYLVFPRLPGVAEIGWSQQTVRNWDEYRNRVARHQERWKAMDIDYYQSPKIPAANTDIAEKN